MEINNTQDFLKYYDRIKGRTRKLFSYIPEDKLEWSYKKGKFTIGDIIRHISCIERFMYTETIKGLPSRYNGCGIAYAEGHEAVFSFYDNMYEESKAVFNTLSEEDLNKKCFTPAGTSITIWKWLRAMVEHEIHHRGQIYMYLGMLDITTPPIYGLTSEEVIEKSV